VDHVNASASFEDVPMVREKALPAEPGAVVDIFVKWAYQDAVVGNFEMWDWSGQDFDPDGPSPSPFRASAKGAIWSLRRKIWLLIAEISSKWCQLGSHEKVYAHCHTGGRARLDNLDNAYFLVVIFSQDDDDFLDFFEILASGPEPEFFLRALSVAWDLGIHDVLPCYLSRVEERPDTNEALVAASRAFRASHGPGVHARA
jgi:hypothetical protein